MRATSTSGIIFVSVDAAVADRRTCWSNQYWGPPLNSLTVNQII